ncbi:hypothetical protein BLCOC_23460 [Blautia coccoides]|uniref:Uncharacterized protein n=1 Tax=Blautia producta TaxID=33035 RepID=A0ABZ0U9T3_9FIRM|nr:hypothetical protein EV205_114109 [Blautia coccoides]WPX73990.1 hypothetical protein BLCOC_23460 [Blautia coccoides]SUY08049.1 Uncharacterised protein [Blautia coccoides]
MKVQNSKSGCCSHLNAASLSYISMPVQAYDKSYY